MSDANTQVRLFLEQLVADGEELGLQVAAYLDGRLVIDAWAGVADETTGRPVDGNTLFTVFSTTKGIVATCIHLLADRGLLDYDAPIATYWPEFAVNGKARATVRHALTHQTGVPQMPVDVTPELLCDWDGMCRRLAGMAPLWEPGSQTGYHAYTFGWILGEIVRRVDGRSIADFVQQEICRPLDLDGLFLGIPDAVEPRVATLKEAPRPPDYVPPADGSLPRLAIPLSVATGEIWNRPDLRRASVPAAGGIMNARSLARHYAALAQGGELDGVRLLSRERVAIASALQTDGMDVVFGEETRRALGYELGDPLSAMKSPTAFGHGGSGGSVGFADPERRLAFGLTKTLLKSRVPGEDTASLVAEVVRSVLDIAE